MNCTCTYSKWIEVNKMVVFDAVSKLWKKLAKIVINIKIAGYSREIISDLDVKCPKECKKVSL